MLEPLPGMPGQVGAMTARARLNRLEFGINSGYPLITSQIDILVTSRNDLR